MHEHSLHDPLLVVALGPHRQQHWEPNADQPKHHLKMSDINKDVVILLLDHFKDLTMQNNAYQRELTIESSAYQRQLINEKIEWAIPGLCGEIVKVKDAFEIQA